MTKIKLGCTPLFYPLPLVIVAALHKGKPTYTTAAYCSLVESGPPMLALGLLKQHYITEAILQSRNFSVNLADEAHLAEADYCGTVSGHQADKAAVFTATYTPDGSCPLIDELPLALHCSLFDMLDLGGAHFVFLGAVEGIYAEAGRLQAGLPQMEALQPVLYAAGFHEYYGLGARLGPPVSQEKRERGSLNE